MNETQGQGGKTEDKLFNFRPACFAAAFLCLGIALSYHVILNGVSAWWLLLLLPILGTPFFFCRAGKYKRTIISVLVLCCSFFIGYFSFAKTLDNFSDCTHYDGEYIVVGKVVDIREYDANVAITLDKVYIDGKGENGRLKAYLSPSFYQNIELSDEVLLRGTVKTNVEYRNDYGFRASDIGDNLRFRMSGVKHCEVTDEYNDIFLKMRQRVTDVVYTGMGNEPAAVTIAVLTGNTSGMEADALENMRAGGIAHVFAVSGLHVGALYAFCLLLYKKTPLKKLPNPVRFFLLAGILLFYGGICGFSPSIIRATVLCLVAYFAKIIGIKTDLLDVLGVGAFIVLCITPTALFEVGFQLSFAACFGIAILAKRIGQVFDEACKGVGKLFKKEWAQPHYAPNGDTLPPSLSERFRRKVGSLISVSLAAQITTAPILLSAFGYLSGWSLVLNFFFVPFISGVFAALLALVFLASLLPISLASGLLYLPNVVWSLVLLLFETVDFSAFTVTGIRLIGPTKVLYYSALVVGTDKLNIPRAWRRGLSAAFFLAFFACACVLSC